MFSASSTLQTWIWTFWKSTLWRLLRERRTFYGEKFSGKLTLAQCSKVQDWIFGKIWTLCWKEELNFEYQVIFFPVKVLSVLGSVCVSECMWVCVCVCVCERGWVWVCVCVSVCVCVCKCVCAYACTCGRVFVCACACTLSWVFSGVQLRDPK